MEKQYYLIFNLPDDPIEKAMYKRVVGWDYVKDIKRFPKGLPYDMVYSRQFELPMTKEKTSKIIDESELKRLMIQISLLTA